MNKNVTLNRDPPGVSSMQDLHPVTATTTTVEPSSLCFQISANRRFIMLPPCWFRIPIPEPYGVILNNKGEVGTDLLSDKGAVYADDPHKFFANALTVKAPLGSVPRS